MAQGRVNMRIYTSKQVLEILDICYTILVGTLGKKPGFKVSHGRWNADLIDAEKSERDYRKQLSKPAAKGGHSYI